MKAEGVGNRISDDIVGLTHNLKSAKKVKLPPVLTTSGNKVTVELAAGIERADQIAASVGKKLQDMSKLLNQIGKEENDIVREQLARFFNVLRAFIEEALQPTGDWSVDQIISGKSVTVDPGPSGVSIAARGEKITMGSLGIPEVPGSPKSEDVQVMMQNIRKAQAAVKKLRNNLATARAQLGHHSSRSSEIIL
jgi:hypothetical protein